MIEDEEKRKCKNDDEAKRRLVKKGTFKTTGCNIVTL